MLAYKLTPTTTKFRAVCTACARRGRIVEDCKTCHGSGEVMRSHMKYELNRRPIDIVKVDRDSRTGIIRYWTDMSEFFYETVTPSLNKYVPEVPHGIHLVHKSLLDAENEANRINRHLEESARVRMISKEDL